MGNRIGIIGVAAAATLVLLTGPAMGQATSGSRTFPIDPYASSTDQPFSSSPYDTETSDGFSTDPFGSEADQAGGDDVAQNQNQGLRDAGTTADTGIGEVGQRQTASDTKTGKNPLDRIDNRIQNRVQNRIRNRIDRTYDPTANATSPFNDANQRTKDAGRER